jgi:hypothetical protein
MFRTFVLDLLGVTGVCNMLLGVLRALGNIHKMGRMLWGQNCFFRGHYGFWKDITFLGGHCDFFIFLAKDILISFQRYNDFSDNSVLYYQLHFKNSPCTIRLEVKENFW